MNLEDVAGKDFNVLPMQILASNCLLEIPCFGFHRWEPNLGLNASGDGHLTPCKKQNFSGEAAGSRIKKQSKKNTDEITVTVWDSADTRRLNG